MSRISNYDELLIERKRLEFKIDKEKKILNSGFQELKESLESFLNLLPAFNRFEKKTMGQSVLGAVVSTGVNLLVGTTVSPRLALLGKLILNHISNRFFVQRSKNQSL